MPDKILVEEPSDPLGQRSNLNYYLPFLQSQLPDCFFFDLKSLLSNLYIQVFTDFKACKELWQEFSPNLSLFDTWDFRYIFHSSRDCQFYFLLIKNIKQNLALLPLAYYPREKQYQWFGTDWQEDNQFLVKDPTFIPILLALAPKKLNLNAILPVSIFQDVIKFKQDEDKFKIDLSNTKNLNNFLKSLGKKHRYNLKRDYQKINNLKPKIIVNNFTDLKYLIKFSNQRFGKDSSWRDKTSLKTFSQILEINNFNKSIQARMISIKIGSQITGVDLILIFNNQYYPLKGGNNVQEFPGIGNYLSLIEIQDALKLGCESIDLLQGDFAWKHRLASAVELWKFSK